ncbi:MAG: hypothetical protein Q9222_006787 [Ikaeria aurantiellina]
MASRFAYCLFFLAAAIGVHANDSCTTLKPVFVPPLTSTSTVYDRTATILKGVDCNGCSLVVSTFPAIVGTTNTAAPTVTSPATTSTEFYCKASTANVTTPTVSAAPFPSVTPTSVPLPPFDPTVQILVERLETAILYVELIGNGGDLPKLCSTINPTALDNETLNGTIVQQEVCAAASITLFAPQLAAAVVEENQIGVPYLETALFAVQTVGSAPGGGV